MLVFLLVQYLKPFASIVFEDFSLLADRLMEIAEEDGFSLFQDRGASEDAACRLIDHMLYVPFSRLSDIASVTMIGSKPWMRPSIFSADRQRSCTDRTQDQRYTYLCACAGNHR